MDASGRTPPLADWLAGYAGTRDSAGSAAWRTGTILAIVAGSMMMLWSLPVPAGVGRPGLYAALAGVGLVGRYLRRSRRLAVMALAGLIMLGAGVAALHAQVGAAILLPAGASLLVAGLIGAGVLALRGRQSLAIALVADLWLGPAWLVARAAARLGLPLQ